MNPLPPIYTITMAQVLEKQGKTTQALSIYRRLLKDDPEQVDILTAIERLEKQTANQLSTDMIATFETWIDLLCKRERVAHLQSLNKALNRKPRKLSDNDNG